MINKVDALISYSQNHRLSSDDIFDKTKKAFQGLQGVENVYTRHVPLITETCNDILKGKLKESLFPFVNTPSKEAAKEKPTDIVIFIVGGCTFSEAMEVYKISKSGARVVLGSTFICNSKRFIFL